MIIKEEKKSSNFKRVFTDENKRLFQCYLTTTKALL